ncbi:MAG: hypothetical protein ACK4F4_11095 [Hylemonella sp.]
MYLNDLSGASFARLVHKAAGYEGAFHKRALEQTYTHETLVDLVGDFEQGSDKLTGHYRTCVGVQRPVRYCAECLAYCYHSPLFQFPVIACCPYHGTPLQEVCRKCGKRLSILGFVPSQHDSPFCCTSCGHRYVPERSLAQRALFGLPAARSTLEVAHQVIIRMGRADIISASGMLTHEFGDDRFIRFHSHALYAASSHGAEIPDWLIGLDHNVCYRPEASTSTAQDLKGREGNSSETLIDHLRPLLSVLRSINRHLSRQVRSVCKHPYPKRLRNQKRSRSWQDTQYYLVYDEGDCPCCAVLAWWRARMGHYFALRMLAKQHRWTLLWNEEQVTLRTLVAAGPAQLAVIAMDAFTSLAVQMHYRINPKSSRLFSVHRDLAADATDHKTLGQAQHIDFLEQRGLVQRYGHLDLDVYAAKEGDDTLYCTDADGRRCTVSWSMVNAMQVLSELAGSRPAGPIKHSDWWKVYRRTVEGAKDPWCCNLSEMKYRKVWERGFTQSFLERSASAKPAAEKNAAAAQA